MTEKPNIPDIIYLQWYGDGDEEPDEIHEGITWSKDDIYNSDIQYIRADRHTAKMREMLEGIDKEISKRYVDGRHLPSYEEGLNDGLDAASRFINDELSKLEES